MVRFRVYCNFEDEIPIIGRPGGARIHDLEPPGTIPRGVLMFGGGNGIPTWPARSRYLFAAAGLSE